MNLREFILNSLQPISEGRNIATYCPHCGKKNKFTASVKQGIVLYNCYSASCTLRPGKFPLNITGEEKIQSLKHRRIEDIQTEWRVPSYWIDGIGNETCFDYLKSKNMLIPYKLGLFRPMYDPADRRFVFPIRNEYGVVEGAVGRALGANHPKVRNYNEKYTKPFMCGDGDNAILVEDCASAVAAARYGDTGVALLGTKIRQEFIPYLSGYRTVYIALDKDAYKHSLKLKKVLEPYVEKIKIVRLSKDIKDMSDKEFEELICSQL